MTIRRRSTATTSNIGGGSSPGQSRQIASGTMLRLEQRDAAGGRDIDRGKARMETVGKGRGVVLQIIEHALGIIKPKQGSRGRIGRDAAAEDGRAEELRSLAHEGPQMVDDLQLLRHWPGQAVQHVV